MAACLELPLPWPKDAVRSGQVVGGLEKHCTSSPSTSDPVGNGFANVIGRLTSECPLPLWRFCSLFSSFSGLAALAGNAVDDGCLKAGVFAVPQICPLYNTFRRLPSHGRSLFRDQPAGRCPPSPCTSLIKKHLAYCLQNESRFRTGDLPTSRSTSPHKSTPMLGVPMHGNCVSPAIFNWKPSVTIP